MSSILNTVTSSISGIIVGSLIFSLSLVIFFYVYIYVYGYLKLFEIAFLGEYYVRNPLYVGFAIGTIIGGIQGLITGFIVNFYDINVLLKGALIGLIVSEAIIFGIHIFISIADEPNLFALIANSIENFPALLKISLVLIVPSVITGTIMTKVDNFFS